MAVNLFILDADRLVLTKLKQFLKNRFGESLNISVFYDSTIFLKSLDRNTHVVILDYHLMAENGLNVLSTIKTFHPNIEVIKLSTFDQIAVAMEAIMVDGKEEINKSKNSKVKLYNVVQHVLAKPLKLIIREFRVSKYLGVFLLTFVIVGLLVSCVLYFMNPS